VKNGVVYVSLKNKKFEETINFHFSENVLQYTSASGPISIHWVIRDKQLRVVN
jgi:hypothetical protein